MGKLTRDNENRNIGMRYVIQRMKVDGASLEEMEDELRKRGAYNIPIGLRPAEIRKYEADVINDVTPRVLRLALAISCNALVEEFDFGNTERNGKDGRLKRFMTRYEKTCEYLFCNKDAVDINALIEQLKNEYNIDLEIV